MNQSIRDQLAAEPRPVDPGTGLAPVCVVADEAGWRLAWARNGGITKEPFGPIFDNPRAAARGAAYIRAME